MMKDLEQGRHWVFDLTNHAMKEETTATNHDSAHN